MRGRRDASGRGDDFYQERGRVTRATFGVYRGRVGGPPRRGPRGVLTRHPTFPRHY